MWRGFRSGSWRLLRIKESASGAIPALMVLHPIEAASGIFHFGKTELLAGKTAEFAQIRMEIGNLDVSEKS